MPIRQDKTFVLRLNYDDYSTRGSGISFAIIRTQKHELVRPESLMRPRYPISSRPVSKERGLFLTDCPQKFKMNFGISPYSTRKEKD